MEKRSNFSGRLGFVFAAAGSAVGLGNLWRFPYLAAQYGGGIFIFVYIILALTFGFTLLSAEIAIGRKTKLSPIRAYKSLHKRFGFLGYLAFSVPVIILPYYCVIGGWVSKYLTAFVTGQTSAAAGDGYFGTFISSTYSPIIFFAIFLVLTSGAIILGVEKGIEKVSKFLMPVLILLTIGISVYGLTMPGALEGLKYYLLPDFGNFSFKTVCAAMGQLFFSMSIAMGIMVTYGSYSKDDVNLNKSVSQIEIFDTGIALLAGLMIIPAVYVFSGEEGLASGGPGLMFVTLPKVFEQMPGGTVIGALFFVLVLLAALTSSISVMEAIVSMIMDKWGLKRTPAALVVLGYTLVVGAFTSLGFGKLSFIQPLGEGSSLLDFFDYLSNYIIMPIVAFATCLLVGWVLKPKTITDEITKNGEKMGRKLMFNIIIKYIAPVLMVVILVFYSLAQFGVIKV